MKLTGLIVVFRRSGLHFRLLLCFVALTGCTITSAVCQVSHAHVPGLGSKFQTSSAFKPIVHLGRFEVPAVRGAKQTWFFGDPLQNVHMRLEHGGAQFEATVEYWKPVRGLPNQTFDGLLQETKDADESAARVGRQFGRERKVVDTRKTRIAGVAGLLEEAIETSKNSIVESRIVRFVYGPSEYWLTLAISARKIDSKTRRFAESIWNKLVTGSKLH